MKPSVKLRMNGKYQGNPCFEVSVELFGLFGMGFYMFHYVYTSMEGGNGRVAVRVNRSLSGRKKPGRDKALGSAFDGEDILGETYDCARDYAARLARSMGREIDDCTPMRVMRVGLDGRCGA